MSEDEQGSDTGDGGAARSFKRGFPSKIDSTGRLLRGLRPKAGISALTYQNSGVEADLLAHLEFEHLWVAPQLGSSQPCR